MQRSMWRHLVVLICLALVVPVAQYASLFHDRAPHVPWGAILWISLLESPRQFYYLLPIAPAIAVGIAYLDRRGVRTALGAVGVSLLVMLAVDVWIAPAADRELAQLAMHPPAGWPHTHASLMPVASSIDSVGALRAGAALIGAQPRELGQHLSSYPPTHPRVIAERVLEDAAVLLLPGILVGIIIGVAAWVHARVIFRSMRDEIVTRWFVSWILAPAAWAVIGTWSRSYGYELLFRDGSLWLPLVPYVPFAVLGALGWRMALQAQEHSDIAWVDASADPMSRPATKAT